jgi:hypothetical protein
MSIAGHGNWCGPGWSAGQKKDAKDLTDEDLDVPAVDQLDADCKAHDIRLRNAETEEDVELANLEFIANAKTRGYKGWVFAELVDWFGPKGMSFFNLLPCRHIVFVEKNTSKKSLCKLRIKMQLQAICTSSTQRVVYLLLTLKWLNWQQILEVW